jgi:hypothetical protein
LIPVSRLREAPASAGEGRSEKIMFKQSEMVIQLIQFRFRRRRHSHDGVTGTSGSRFHF